MSLSPLIERLAANGRAIRSALAVVFAVALYDRNWGAVVNAFFAMVATFLPDAVERVFDVSLSPWQTGYARIGPLLHAVGMLGPYDDVWWWDHVTHAHSATVLGAIVHVLSRRRGEDPWPRVLGTVTVAGLVWEAAEYVAHRLSARLGIEPVLEVYGPVDTVVDMGFNLLGAALVLLLGDRALRNFFGKPEGGPRERPESGQASVNRSGR